MISVLRVRRLINSHRILIRFSEIAARRLAEARNRYPIIGRGTYGTYGTGWTGVP